ncbi:hypothetical protein GGR57DRAFT_506658 [Xylariaceae sp. FL1272]|nr:hypothetical protein GGR57DRAFT_506658 [Xylariaceae sp. FL1272]
MAGKPRCTFKECKSAAQRIVGDCGFCDGHFCAKHRLLEDHKCTGLEDVSLSSPESSSASSSPKTPSPLAVSSLVTDDFSNTQWWLVGLAEYLSEDDLLPFDPKLARRSLTSGMPHS